MALPIGIFFPVSVKIDRTFKFCMNLFIAIAQAQPKETTFLYIAEF